MKHTICFLIASVLCAVGTFGNTDNNKLLNELDKVIMNKAMYRIEKENGLDELKLRLSGTSSPQLKYDICDSLFRGYLHYQADSALLYINRKIELNKTICNPQLTYEIKINRAEVLGVMGMYNEAFLELQRLDASRLDRKTLIYYYKTCRACYGWMSDYALGIASKEEYQKSTNAYRDSILLTIGPGVEHDIVWAEKMLLNGDSDIAMRKLLEEMNNLSGEEPLENQLKSYIYYTLSEVYKSRNDRDKEIYYLALTSISDLKSSIREYASLQKLAHLMYESGDVNRAYNYLSRSMEDAVSCNARLRFIEVSQFFPIIDEAHNMEQQKDKRILRCFLITLSLFGVALIILVIFLYRWMKRLTAIRRFQSMTNQRMSEVNKKLEETGKIKDVYIAKYLDRCANYLNKLDAYRRSLVKLAVTSRIDELFKAIKSEQFISDERKNFYNEFDRSFLELFPDFVNAFNSLIVEEGRIYPKSGELLTTELRIFALIRLGVTDSNRIASFLGYSLATIYNYRSKMRNKAIGSKERFEQDVMELFTSL